MTANEDTGTVKDVLSDHSQVECEITVRQTEDVKQSTRCNRCKARLLQFLRPILWEYHPMPSNPGRLREFLNHLYCPPHGRIGAILFVVFLGFVWWGTLYSLTGDVALPGGNLFSLFLVLFFCWSGGYVVQIFNLPPLLGMLIVGVMLGNVPKIDIAKNIGQEWSSGCRQIALAIILVRAGLGLDPAALRRLSLVVIRLAFSPCLAESITDGIASHLILGFPWVWGFILGQLFCNPFGSLGMFVIAAVSPAVVVPCLLSLSERGYGLNKGVPTLVIAAASIDDVLAITGFGVFIGIAFSTGDLAWNIVKGPLEAIVGILIGITIGVILWYVPQRNSKNLILFRSSLLVGFALLVIFGSKKVEWSGSGPLAALTLAFVAALRWRKEYKQGEMNPVEGVVGVLWMIFQPLLFGLIGAAVDVSKLEAKTVGMGIAVLGIGLSVRCCVAYLAVMGTNLTKKEKLFIPVSWLPKATVQAAIGAIAFDMATEKKDEELIGYGETILQLAVLSILITAPIGAALVTVLGPILLHRSPADDRLHRAVQTVIEQPQLEPSDQDIKNSGGAVTENNVEGNGITRSESLGMADRKENNNKVGEEGGNNSNNDEAITHF
ncbi:hypothetical protein ACOMHN_026768 [Nucella lapillus]